MRLFLTDAGYRKFQERQEKGEIKIQEHLKVAPDDCLYHDQSRERLYPIIRRFEKEILNMTVFRVEKTKDFTIMSNCHLRDVELLLKAKGILSLTLSLPEDWDYTTKGLAHICKDGVDSIISALKELENHGYLTRQRIRYGNGRWGDITYTIHEKLVGRN